MRQRPGRDVLVQKVRFRNVPPFAVGGLVLTLKSHGSIVARHPVSLGELENGVRSVRWKLPRRVKPGAYKVTARQTVVTAGAEMGSKTVSRTSSLRVAR